MAGELRATGVELAIGDAATPEVFTVIPGVQGIPTVPALIPPEIDVTALDSTGAEYILGLGDGGEMTFTINIRRPPSGTGYLAAQQTLAGYAGDNVLRGWRVQVKDGVTTRQTISGKCFVKSFQEQAAGPNAAVTAQVTLRISGGITRANS